jgi:predicted lipase
VQTLLQNRNTSSVAVIGHSLGAALALLDLVCLPLRLPAGTQVSMVGYGMPRVSNPAFANYVDAMHDSATATVTRINNKKDPIPTVPWQFMGFAHPAGEVHIQDDSSNSWVACPCHDNPSIVGDVPNVLKSNISDHSGLYDDGIFMGTSWC